ncbi:hypothetical protein KXD40_000863 [Peronospora effusa]|uniref:Uncharacterized protein n=1 Tax=Peronospora effusa TaxID=542832 RepID=A0A3R8CP56_9STRA|nr:hypothetical protein DD237_008487 [Peronospora effusa]UIZ21378.1 hypothetical protein KXD40_000863 [Peronospora effusa]CAI5705570.1 unnamed protein product [Peronospora effusa]
MAAQGTTPATPREFFRVSLPRFRGGTAQDWLQWLPNFERLAKLQRWNSRDKSLYLGIILEHEASHTYTEAFSSVTDIDNDEQFDLSMQMMGLAFVQGNYCERLEGDIHMMVKKRAGSVASLHFRMMKMVRMLKNLPEGALGIDEPTQVRYFNRAMPGECKRAYEISENDLLTMT